MQKRPFDIPSLTGLAAFEAAARHLSFKMAAHELNVTAPAVSRQIKCLEQELGTVLFLRRHRHVQLTADGVTLFRTLNDAFSSISNAVQATRSSRHGQVRVGTTNAMVSLWLMPRLQDFWRRYPHIRLHHVISDEAINMTVTGADVAIRYGGGVWPGLDAQMLFPDRVSAVCSPAYAVRHGPFERAHDLIDHTLLEITDVSAEDWPGWKTWFRALDIHAEPRELRYFDSYSVAVQAAMDGLGIVMGWHSMIKPAIEEGKLIRIVGEDVTPEGAFYMITRDHKPLSPDAATFAAWLREQAALDSRAG